MPWRGVLAAPRRVRAHGPAGRRRYRVSETAARTQPGPSVGYSYGPSGDTHGGMEE